jgi:ABC-type polysaccharide/polyol phosphate export permease
VLTSHELLRTLIERQLRLRSKRTWFGVVWPLVAPLFLLALYVFVFQGVLDEDMNHYGEFLCAGLLPWTFIAISLPEAVTSLSQEPELIRRAPFPHALLPISAVLMMAMYFTLTLSGFVVYLAIVGRLAVGLLPVLAVPVAALVLLAMGLGTLLSLIDVYNRDLRAVLANLLTIWFFLVPIVYRPERTPSALRFLRSVDPMNLIVGQFRDILFWGHLSRPVHLVTMLALCGAVFVLAVVIVDRCIAILPQDV